MPSTRATPVPPELFDQFFDRLAGPDNIYVVQGALAETVNTPNDKLDKFQILARAVDGVVNWATRNLDVEDTEESRLWKENIFAQGKVGVTGTVDTLRAIDRLYVNRASAPQEHGNVIKNTHRALRHLHKVAFSGAEIGKVNLEALYLGLNPKNPLLLPLIELSHVHRTRALKGNISHRAFRVSKDKEGQLDINPKYSHLPEAGDRKCPATGAIVETISGPRSGLYTFMKIMGTVAIEEIFPHDFKIVR
jgi:hypothetical protein